MHIRPVNQVLSPPVNPVCFRALNPSVHPLLSHQLIQVAHHHGSRLEIPVTSLLAHLVCSLHLDRLYVNQLAHHRKCQLCSQAAILPHSPLFVLACNPLQCPLLSLRYNHMVYLHVGPLHSLMSSQLDNQVNSPPALLRTAQHCSCPFTPVSKQVYNQVDSRVLILRLIQ